MYQAIRLGATHKHSFSTLCAKLSILYSILEENNFSAAEMVRNSREIYNCFDETSNNWHLVFLVQTLETTDFQTTPVQNEHQHIQNLSYKNYFITVVFILLLKDNPNVLLRDNHFIHCRLFNIVLISGRAR